jgi:hypothetical protein
MYIELARISLACKVSSNCNCNNEPWRRERPMSDATRFGEQMGDFLRGLLRTPSALTPQASETVPTRKWAVVDASEVGSGTMVSLDLELDPGEIPGQLSNDVEAFGIAHFRSGETCFLNVVVAKDYANAISLIPGASPMPAPPPAWAAGDPSTASVSASVRPEEPVGPEELFRKWNLVADGDIQPFSSPPYEITFSERTVPETDVVRIGGQIFNPKSQVRINYSVTHDPIEYVILAVVVGIAALICGGVVLSDDILNRGKNRAREHCEHGVKKLTIKRKYGFGWNKGVTVGCGEEYIIECNQAPGPPVLRAQPRRRRSSDSS